MVVAVFAAVKWSPAVVIPVGHGAPLSIMKRAMLQVPISCGAAQGSLILVDLAVEIPTRPTGNVGIGELQKPRLIR